MRKHVMVVVGTRPEAIKMAPVITALKARPEVRTQVVVTAQHREMLDQVLELFDIVPDDDLDIMRPGQSLPALFSRLLEAMDALIARDRPHLVLVHGDTSTTFATALAAYYNQTAVGHVEAGLRTGDVRSPWPEEANRRLTAPLAELHFAPTPSARENLIAEGIPAAQIHVTGNTVIDALLDAADRIATKTGLRAELDNRFSFLDPHKRLVLVTGHRRENIGNGMDQICTALRRILARGDTQVIYPLHLNPVIREPVTRALAGCDDIHLIAPQPYLPFVYLMTRADLILTDSGGIQEEAPSLGKTVLVMRETTERPEALAAGTVTLVGTDPDRIFAAASTALDATGGGPGRIVANPFGDGKAAARIAEYVAAWA